MLLYLNVCGLISAHQIATVFSFNYLYELYLFCSCLFVFAVVCMSLAVNSSSLQMRKISMPYECK